MTKGQSSVLIGAPLSTSARSSSIRPSPSETTLSSSSSIAEPSASLSTEQSHTHARQTPLHLTHSKWPTNTRPSISSNATAIPDHDTKHEDLRNTKIAVGVVVPGVVVLTICLWLLTRHYVRRPPRAIATNSKRSTTDSTQSKETAQTDVSDVSHNVRSYELPGSPVAAELGQGRSSAAGLGIDSSRILNSRPSSEVSEEGGVAVDIRRSVESLALSP